MKQYLRTKKRMDFHLDRDLVFLDAETTGLNIVRDRMLQLALIKYPANGGAPIEWCQLINPEIPIAEEATAIHGYTSADLADKPTFATLAQQILTFIGDADLAGYNSTRFDVPMLIEEFGRVGIAFDITKRRLIDAQRIFYKMEPRTLRAAYQLYCGQTLADAHDALADVRATADVLRGQLKKYVGQDLIDEDGNLIAQPIQNDMQVLHDFINDLRFAEPTQRLKHNAKGELAFNFGKYVDQSVRSVFEKDKNYYYWIQEKDFSTQVKQMVKTVWESMTKK